MSKKLSIISPYLICLTIVLSCSKSSDDGSIQGGPSPVSTPQSISGNLTGKPDGIYQLKRQNAFYSNDTVNRVLTFFSGGGGGDFFIFRVPYQHASSYKPLYAPYFAPIYTSDSSYLLLIASFQWNMFSGGLAVCIDYQLGDTIVGEVSGQIYSADMYNVYVDSLNFSFVLPRVPQSTADTLIKYYGL